VASPTYSSVAVQDAAIEIMGLYLSRFMQEALSLDVPRVVMSLDFVGRAYRVRSSGEFATSWRYALVAAFNLSASQVSVAPGNCTSSLTASATALRTAKPPFLLRATAPPPPFSLPLSGRSTTPLSCTCASTGSSRFTSSYAISRAWSSACSLHLERFDCAFLAPYFWPLSRSFNLCLLNTYTS
jgi:hypothetical protein